MRLLLFGSSGLLGSAIDSHCYKNQIDVVKFSKSDHSNNSIFIDLANVGSIREALCGFEASDGDVAIINSGILGEVGKSTEVSIENVSNVLNINAISNIELFNNLYDKGVKTYIVISSGASEKNYTGWFSYCQSKQLQRGIWAAISKDYNDIVVRLIAPGVLNSTMHDFTNNVEKGRYPDLDKFYELRVNGGYQNEIESAFKILKITKLSLNSNEKFSYIDLRKF